MRSRSLAPVRPLGLVVLLMTPWFAGCSSTPEEPPTSELMPHRPIELSPGLEAGDYALFEIVTEPDEYDASGARQGAGRFDVKSVTVTDVRPDGSLTLEFARHGGSTISEGTEVVSSRSTFEELIQRWLHGLAVPPDTKFHVVKVVHHLPADGGAVEVPCERIDLLTPSGFRAALWFSGDVPGGVVRIGWRNTVDLLSSHVELVGLRARGRTWGKAKPDDPKPDEGR